MTLLDIDNGLPNGFHDSELRQLTIDYATKIATLELSVWIGDMDAPPGEERERYKPASLRVSGLGYLSMEPPDASYPYQKARPITVDLCEPEETARREAEGKGLFSARFFIMEWNSFITITALNAELIWKEE